MGTVLGGTAVSTAGLPGDGAADIAPDTSWKVYGTDRSEVANTISLDDGGAIYLYGTSFRRDRAVSYDIFGVKTDRRGRMVWDRRPQSDGTEVISDSTATADGTVVVGFDSDPSDSEDHFLMEKRGSDGAVHWTRDLGPGRASRVRTGHDGGVVTVGIRYGDSDTNPGPVVIQLRDDGSTVWKRRLPLPSEMIATALTRTTDGGYLVGGSPRMGGTDGFVAKTNVRGRTDWHQQYAFGPKPEVRSVVEPTSGEYILAVNTVVDARWRSSIVKIDADGRQIWRTRIGGTGENICRKLLADEAGNSWVCGSATSKSKPESEAYLLEVHQNGDIASRVTVGGAGSDQAFDMARSADGGFLLAGRSTSTQTKGTDAWLAKIGGEDRLANPDSDSDLPVPLLAGSAVALGGAALLGWRYLRGSTE